MSGRESGGFFARRLAGAREDAVRIARELAAHGHLSESEARELEDAVGGAIERGRALLASALREPRRALESLRDAPGAAPRPSAGDPASPDGEAGAAASEVTARLLDLEERIARLEQAIALLLPGVRRGEADRT